MILNLFISSMYFLFRYHLPLKKGGALQLNKLESPSSEDALCQVWLELVQWFWRWFCQCIFAISLLSPLGKGRGSSFEKKFNPLHPKMLYAEFSWSGSLVLMKIIFLILSMYFPYYLPLEKCEALCLNKHESPSYKDDLVKLP